MAVSALLPAGPLLAAGPWGLAAGLDDFIWVIILVISFVVWIYNQIKKANEEAAKKPEGPPPDLDAPPAPPRTTQTGAPSGQKPSVRGKQQQPTQRTPARPALADRASISMPQGEEEPWARREAVASHVQRHLDTQEFEQRTGSLGQLRQLDSQVDERVEQIFAHEVRTIADQGATTEAEQQAGGIATVGLTAAGIAELFADPDRLRNAIILQEVLRPPQWD